MNRKSVNGFTLIELMVVLTVIAIIVAIAIPNLMRSRSSANEASAIKSVRAISTGQTKFRAAAVVVDVNGISMFGTLAQLSGQNPPFIDRVLGSGSKQGYNFAVDLTAQGPGNPAFSSTATPLNGQFGNRSFFVDESGVITFTSDGSVPDALSAPIQ